MFWCLGQRDLLSTFHSSIKSLSLWFISSAKRGTSTLILANLLQRLHALFAQYFGAWWEQTVKTALLCFQVFGANLFSTMPAMQREEGTKKKRYLTLSAMQLRQNQFAKELAKFLINVHLNCLMLIGPWSCQERLWKPMSSKAAGWQTSPWVSRQVDWQGAAQMLHWQNLMFFSNDCAWWNTWWRSSMLPKRQGMSLMLQQKFKRCGWTNFSSQISLWVGKGVTKLSNFWWLANAPMLFGATSSSRWVTCGLLATNHLELPRFKKSAFITLTQFRWLQPKHVSMKVMRLPLLGSRTVDGRRWRFLFVSTWSWRFLRPCFLQSASISRSEDTRVFATKSGAGCSWSIVVTMLRTSRKPCCFCLRRKNVPSPARTACFCDLFLFKWIESGIELFPQALKDIAFILSACIIISMFHSESPGFSRMKEMDEDNNDEAQGEDQERMEGQSDEEAEDEVLREMVAAVACCEGDELDITSKDENHEPTEMVSEKVHVEASTEFPETPRKDMKLRKEGLINCFFHMFLNQKIQNSFMCSPSRKDLMLERNAGQPTTECHFQTLRLLRVALWLLAIRLVNHLLSRSICREVGNLKENPAGRCLFVRSQGLWFVAPHVSKARRKRLPALGLGDGFQLWI